MDVTRSTIPLVTFECEQDPTPLPPEGKLSTRAQAGWVPPDWLLDAIKKAEEEGWIPPPPPEDGQTPPK